MTDAATGNQLPKVVVDALIYQHQAVGGISRIYNELLPRMCDQAESLQILLFTIGDHWRQPPPRHARIARRTLPNAERHLRPSSVWRYAMPVINAARQRIWLGAARNRIWYSTYYTLPTGWDGPKILTVYDMLHERLPSIFASEGDQRFREWKARCVRSADAIVTISDTTKRDLLHFVPLDETKVHVIPLGVSNAFSSRGLAGDPPESAAVPIPAAPYVLYVGPRNALKNFWGMTHAYASWPGRHHTRLIAAGGGAWTRDEQQRLIALKVEDRVHLQPVADDVTLALLYHRAAVFVHPSLYEGFGLPILEALACGCPVVASRIPSSLEIAGDCPIYFDPSETGTLVSALDQALAEGRPSPRTVAGTRRAESFSWDRTASVMLELLKRFG